MTRDRGDLRRALRVYAITPDPADDPDGDLRRLRAAIAAGVRVVQLRDKRTVDLGERRARALRFVDACRRAGAIALLNDDPDLARDVGADGVHVGPRDLPVDEARRRLGPDAIIGASAGTLERAIACVDAGADYLGVGAIFDAAPTKPDASAPRGTDLLRTLRAHPRLADFPIVAIGGIDRHNARACFDAGADGVAAVRDLLGAPDTADAVTAFLAAATPRPRG